MEKNTGLYLILTDPVAGYDPCAEAAVDCGVRFLQLRMKGAPRSTVLETARRIREITRGSPTRFIVNDDIEVAIESDADGIHLGQDDLPLGEARRRWGASGKIFGLSTHSREQAVQALDDSPDYIGVGPVFATPTKPDAAPPLGVEETARIVRATPLPAVAIGGIGPGNLPDLLKAGIENFCVVRAVNLAPDPRSAIEHLQSIWQKYCFRC